VEEVAAAGVAEELEEGESARDIRNARHNSAKNSFNFSKRMINCFRFAS
jgi:hypothetical protein